MSRKGSEQGRKEGRKKGKNFNYYFFEINASKEQYVVESFISRPPIPR